MATASAVTASFVNPGIHVRDFLSNYLANGISLVIERFKQQGPPPGMACYRSNDELMTRDTAIHQPMLGLGYVHKSSDDKPVPMDVTQQGFRNTFTADTFRLGVRITRRMIETDQYGKIKDMQTKLVRAVNDSIAFLCADSFNQGFSTTSAFNCADGLQLFASSRPYEDPAAGTWSNVDAVSATLTEDSLFTMRTSFQNNKNERGIPAPLDLKRLYIPPALERKAYEIVKSDLRPNDAQNAKNFWSGRLTYQVDPFLTSATAWFGMGPDDENHELYWMWGAKPKSSTLDEGSNDDVKIQKIRFVAVRGCDRPHNLRGNQGA